MSEPETEQCEELFCEKDARWIFEGPACEPTPLCDDHAIEFPNDRLRKADDVHRADGGEPEDWCDHEENCAACGVNPRADGSRYCESCRGALLTDGGQPLTGTEQCDLCETLEAETTEEVVEKADEIGAKQVSPEDQQTLSEVSAGDDENRSVDTGSDRSRGER